MGLFSKKKESAAQAAPEVQDAPIKVLGGGCAKCNELEANTKAALKELGMTDGVQLITDFSVIAGYGVMSTPALVLDGKVVSSGKVLKAEEIKELLRKR